MKCVDSEEKKKNDDKLKEFVEEQDLYEEGSMKV